MGLQLLKQPDGNYAIFSSYSDTLVGLSYTREELVEKFAKEAADEARRQIENILDKVEANDPKDPPYYQFTMNWEEALKSHRKHKANQSPEWNAKVEEMAATFEKPKGD